MDKTDFKHTQIQAIKLRLNNAREKSGMTIYKLSEALKDKTEFSNIHFNTVQSALDCSKDALDITVVIAICRLLHLDTAYILSPPGTPDPGDIQNQTVNGKFIVLDDPRYMGSFHGFFYTPNPERDELIRFELDIKPDGDSISATMVYHGRPVDVRGQVSDDTRTLFGIPYLDTVHSNVSIQLTNDQGDFYFLFFTRQQLRSHNLYFRRGIAATASSISTKPPLLQNFVIFSLEVPESKLCYIPGLLADVAPTFNITEDKLTLLRSEYPVVEEFYNNFKYILDHDSTTVYPISETNILSANSPAMDREDIVKSLLLLKGSSIGSKRHVYDELDSYGSFSKNFLQKQE